jgi:hypothetical protein
VHSPDTSQSTDGEVYSLSHRDSNAPQRKRNLNYSKMPNTCRVDPESKVKPVPGLPEIASARSW